MRKIRRTALAVVSVLALPLLAGAAWAAELPAPATPATLTSTAGAQTPLGNLAMPEPLDLTVYYDCYQDAQCWTCEITDTWAQRICIQRSCVPGGDSEDCWYY
jgi:hypothetical protein